VKFRMIKFKKVIFTFVLFIAISSLTKGQNQEIFKIDIEFFKNNKTFNSFNNAKLQIFYPNDTIVIPISDNSFVLEDSIDLNFTTCSIQIDTLELEINIFGEENFSDVFQKDFPAGTWYINFYDDINLAIKMWGSDKQMNKMKQKKIFIIWNYEWYCCDILNY
jgi:hypothetical protein